MTSSSLERFRFLSFVSVRALKDLDKADSNQDGRIGADFFIVKNY